MDSLERDCKALELLKAQAQTWNHIFSYIKSMSLKCAVELGIADTIHNHGKPISLPELATKLSIPPTRNNDLRRLMRLLVFSGFFARKSGEGDNHDEKEELYLPTAMSALLVVKEKDASVSPFLLFVLDKILVHPWYHLSSWFKQDEVDTSHEVAHGRGIWETAIQSPSFSSLLNEGMASDARFVAKLLVEECSEIFRDLRSLVDVGGGTGTMARAIAEAYPQVKCTVFDLPHVVASVEASEAVQVVGGDMFRYVPPADAVLLKWVLHDWSDDECVEILKRCKEAVPSKEEEGKVIIIEMVVDLDVGSPELAETQLLFDMHMMVQTTGKQRNEYEWSKIFINAGFSDYKIIPSLGLRSVIEVYH